MSDEHAKFNCYEIKHFEFLMMAFTVRRLYSLYLDPTFQGSVLSQARTLRIIHMKGSHGISFLDVLFMNR